MVKKSYLSVFMSGSVYISVTHHYIHCQFHRMAQVLTSQILTHSRPMSSVFKRNELPHLYKFFYFLTLHPKLTHQGRLASLFTPSLYTKCFHCVCSRIIHVASSSELSLALIDNITISSRVYILSLYFQLHYYINFFPTYHPPYIIHE